MFGWGEEGNKRYAPRCPRGSGSKIPFEILIHRMDVGLTLVNVEELVDYESTGMAEPLLVS